jgi:hypothetical protein
MQITIGVAPLTGILLGRANSYAVAGDCQALALIFNLSLCILLVAEAKILKPAKATTSCTGDTQECNTGLSLMQPPKTYKT